MKVLSLKKKPPKNKTGTIFLSDLSSQKTMCLSHPHRKTSFIQQQCEITMFQGWRRVGCWGGGGWSGSSREGEILALSEVFR